MKQLWNKTKSYQIIFIYIIIWAHYEKEYAIVNLHAWNVLGAFLLNIKKIEYIEQYFGYP